MKKLALSAVSLIAVLLFSSSLLPITTQAAGETTAEIGSAVTVTGGITILPINIKNISGSAGLGAYDLQVRFDPSGLRVTGLAAGTDSYFGVPVHKIDNIEGVVFLNAFHARIPGPTGDVNIASIEVLALASGTWTMEPGITTLADTQGNEISASPGIGIIKVTPGPAVEVKSAFLPLNSTTSIPVILKDISQAGLPASCSLKVTFSAPSLKIESVKGGDSPYNKTPAYTVDTSQQAVTITASHSGETQPGSSSLTLAYIEVVPTTGERITATVSILSLKGAGGADIRANTIPGLLWALPPATVAALPATLTIGEYAAVTIRLNNVSSILGLGSYELEAAYDPKAIKVHRVAEYPMPDKTGVQSTSSISEGVVTTACTINRKPGPTGNISLIELMIQGMEPGQHPIAINVKSLKDTAGQPIQATVVPSGVTVKPITTVQIGSASLAVGTSGKVAISLRDYDDPDGLGNIWVDITFPQRVLEVSSISAGDVPFESQPKQQVIGTDTPVGLITIISAPARNIKPAPEIILAYLTVMPLAEGEFRFTLRGGNVTNSRNQPISAKAIEGTISARSPFVISNLAINPRQPDTRETATLTATITNTTGTQATYPARLWIGATLEESGNIILEPNQTRNISFKVARENPGVYKAMLGEADLLFTVANRSDLKPSNLALNPSTPKAGETVNVSAKIENNGKVEAIYTARLKLNQFLRDTREISVKPGEKRELNFSLADLPPGEYVVDLDGLTASFSIPGYSFVSPVVLLAIVAALEAIVITLLLLRKRRPA